MDSACGRHIHGGPFEIVATDGNPVPQAARLAKHTVLMSPGERYDVVWTARNPGKWLLHCHVNHHITNDGAEVAGGRRDDDGYRCRV